MAKLVGCDTAPSVKECMVKLAPLAITSLTYSGSWSPTTDGVTIPYDPMTMLADGKVNNCSIILGANTNDSNLFLFRDYTKGFAPQPNNNPNGDLKNISALTYTVAVESNVGKEFLAEALELYPPTKHKSIENVHQLGRVETDGVCTSAPTSDRQSILCRIAAARVAGYCSH
jgi:hypothetical protein